MELNLKWTLLSEMKKNGITLIQVAKDISDSSALQRETNAIIRASQKINSKHLLLINEDKEEIIENDNNQIQVIPLWKYLISTLDN